MDEDVIPPSSNSGTVTPIIETALPFNHCYPVLLDFTGLFLCCNESRRHKHISLDLLFYSQTAAWVFGIWNCFHTTVGGGTCIQKGHYIYI